MRDEEGYGRGKCGDEVAAVVVVFSIQGTVRVRTWQIREIQILITIFVGT